MIIETTMFISACFSMFQYLHLFLYVSVWFSLFLYASDSAVCFRMFQQVSECFNMCRYGSGRSACFCIFSMAQYFSVCH